MSTCLIDTNVLFKIFAGNANVRRFVESSDSAIDVTVYIECLQGSKSNAEKRIIAKYLDNFPFLPITPEISKRAIDLINIYSNSFGLLLPDALIASTALENGLIVVTYNIKDFSFIDGLEIRTPSE